MTQGNIHYLIGWAGAILIVLIVAVGLTRHRKHTCEDDENNDDTGSQT